MRVRRLATVLNVNDLVPKLSQPVVDRAADTASGRITKDGSRPMLGDQVGHLCGYKHGIPALFA